MERDLLNALSWLDWSLVLTYLRIQACILLMPGFGERAVPGRVKVAVAMALAPLLSDISGSSWAGSVGEVALNAMLGLAIAELLIGFAIGAMVRMMAFAINVAATVIASTASLSQIIGAPNEASPHPVGNLFHLGGVALLLALGLPLLLIGLLADSFVLWPVAQLPEIDGLVQEFIGIIARSFELAMLLSAPFILGGFLFQALSGVINRVMPALPVVFIGAPAAIGLALIALVMLSPMILSIWADAVLSSRLPVSP
ncbi:flagellar biosynthetic protein FliR [Paracoccus tegillarcae]|uniref:Type III secretion protein n=1 Tax=Paracoccus tegillarcae TaxID=1529068 RepID=A0A2K9EWU4_9RHOB|nr:flagellar biosynthetic protein FliR [Paracoccus tegillarcae]AUH33764.1 type III secretion protein [Paracoccus tegillarcae]